MPEHREGKSMSADALQCPDCGTSLAVPSRRARGAWRCPRCDSQLSGAWALRPDSLLALTVATAVLWLPALILPLMRLENLGLDRQASLLDCVLRLMEGVYFPCRYPAVVYLGGDAVTEFVIGRAIVVGGPCGQSVGGVAGPLLDEDLPAKPGMGDDRYFFLLGILIAMTKLGDMATVTAGPGLFCLVVAVLLRLIVETLAQPDQLQRLLEARHGH